MANIGQKGGVFHVRFRLLGREYKKSLKTRDESAARAARHLIELTLHRVHTGQLQLPPDAVLREARLDLLLDGEGGEAGHPDDPQDGFLDRLVAAEFEGHPQVVQRQPVPVEGHLEAVTQARPGLPQDERVCTASGCGRGSRDVPDSGMVIPDPAFRDPSLA